MRWWPWSRRRAEQDQALARAERTRAEADRQREVVDQVITPRVEELSESLHRLRRQNNFGPMIENVLKGGRS